MAKFKVGDPKPTNSGRQKGTGNKTTAEIRDAIQKVLANKVDELADDLAVMPEFKQWQILTGVAKYCLPALNKNEDTIEHSGEVKITVSFLDSDKNGTEDFTDFEDKG